MGHTTQVNLSYNEPLSLLLAMQREVSGRRPWEICLLPPPHTPDVGLFADGMRMLRDAGSTRFPTEVAEAADVDSFASSLTVGGGPQARGWNLIQRSLAASARELRTAIERAAPSLSQATAYIQDTVIRDERRCGEVLADALGVAGADRPLPIYLVPFASFPPGAEFLVEHGAPRAAYLDYRRFSGPSLLEGVLTLLSWYLLSSSAAEDSLSHRVAAGLTGSNQAKGRLHAIVMKLLIGMTAHQLVREYEPGFRGTIAAFGQDLRFPRLLAAIRRPWQHYLQGRTSRATALEMISQRLAEQPASWFVEQVDASSLAADFYLLEWLAAQGDTDAAARLHTWQPRLAADFARHIDLAIGAELVHYDGIPLGTLAPELAEFIQQTCDGNALLRWPAIRRSDKSLAYRMAEEAFRGPGAEYGGEAWAPIARLMADYTDVSLSERMFVDQCFTLEHNNGCLFDKFLDTWEMKAALEAQAQGNLSALSARASAEVRSLWQRHVSGARREGSEECSPDRRAATPWDKLAQTISWPDGFHDWPSPGCVGCGSNAALPEPGARIRDDLAKPLFRGKIRTPLSRDVPKLRSVIAVLHTDLGAITLELDPRAAPKAVGSFVQLARGEVAWWDPATGGPGTGGFYDGTRFHRIVPDLFLQGGDRTETGRGGPGFRYDEERTDAAFDRPYRVAMVNTGVVTNGSQFFITLAAAPHLDGRYTVIGNVADDGSREIAHRLSYAAASDPRIRRVEIDAR